MKRRIRTRAGVYGIPVILGCSLVFAFTASAANSNKPYSVVICGNGQTGCTSSNPAVVAPGGSTSNPATLTVTFKNNNKLGSGIAWFGQLERSGRAVGDLGHRHISPGMSGLA